MFLEFESQQHQPAWNQSGGEKWYARTPAGEYAFSDSQGLYEWRDGKRIQYTGGDRQCSDPGGMWTMHGGEEARMEGFRHAIKSYREVTN